MTPDEAADLAARTLAAIERSLYGHGFDVDDRHEKADRERVASDLAGLRDCDEDCWRCGTDPCPNADRYADGLRRTAALYGVEPTGGDMSGRRR